MDRPSPNPPLLAPSLLGGDHANLAGSAREIQAAGARWAHLDIMDGHFVDNLTFGPGTLAALRKHVPTLFYDVHLMLDNPEAYIEPFAREGAGMISIHIEPAIDHAALLARIRELGCKCCIAINPGTDWQLARHLLGQVDMVLAMTVHPGRGGQPFRDDVLPKIEALSALRAREGLSFRIEVDGGVDTRTGRACAVAGADTFVTGTAFFRAGDHVAFRKTFEE
jgi:ribulose-phosphate 3-epimerase